MVTFTEIEAVDLTSDLSLTFRERANAFRYAHGPISWDAFGAMMCGCVHRFQPATLRILRPDSQVTSEALLTAFDQIRVRSCFAPELMTLGACRPDLVNRLELASLRNVSGQRCYDVYISAFNRWEIVISDHEPGNLWFGKVAFPVVML